MILEDLGLPVHHSSSDISTHPQWVLLLQIAAGRVST